MAESLQIQIKEDDIDTDKAHNRVDRSIHEVNSLETTFLVANFILELPSAVFDQLSSVHKPQFAILSMVMSFIVLIISITDLIHKGRKEGVRWMIRGSIPWFYHPDPNSKPFGTFPDIIGLVCAIFQCLFASIAYAFLSQQVDNPLKVSVWPVIFAFGLLFSRLSRNPSQKSPTKHESRLNNVVEFTLAELAVATNDFSLQNKIGIGSYGTVYKGKLADGSERAVKRWKKGSRTNFLREERNTFESELELLSRLHHKHLVRIFGYYEDNYQLLLAYEYIRNGSLFDHLHYKNSNVINSWKMRIKIALDSARGIEYLHNYAVPPVIHADIKSSNILLDADWTARVSGFGFSLLAPETGDDSRPMRAADSDNHCRNILTPKSDVYGFGVVLLELLTGKRAIFKDEDSEETPEIVENFAVPKIISGELVKVLDSRVGLPEINEEEAVELMAYTALHCVNFERKNRPNMTDVVANLERSWALCVGSSVQDEEY